MSRSLRRFIILMLAVIMITATVFAQGACAFEYDAGMEEPAMSVSEDPVPREAEHNHADEDRPSRQAEESHATAQADKVDPELKAEKDDQEQKAEDVSTELKAEDIHTEPQEEGVNTEPQGEDVNTEPQTEAVDTEPEAEDSEAEPQTETSDEEAVESEAAPQAGEGETVQPLEGDGALPELQINDTASQTGETAAAIEAAEPASVPEPAPLFKVTNTVENGIPVLKLTIDPEEFQKLMDSPDHSYRATGATVNIELPEGYIGEFGSIDPATIDQDLLLDFIRGRGNSTWGAGKNPFKFKLEKSADLLGMGKNKHWVLLANHYDASLLRNRIITHIESSFYGQGAGAGVHAGDGPRGLSGQRRIHGQLYGQRGSAHRE